jgi:hypothetical protein
MKNIFYHFVSIIFLFFISFQCRGKDTLVNKIPAAVLVQLRSEHNRIEKMKEANMPYYLRKLKEDAVGVKTSMINDFTDNFNYCHVYYFMDTNLHLVLDGMFNNVLLNADGSPATNITANFSKQNYLIVYYGYPISQSKTEKEVTDSLRYIVQSDPPSGKGLMVNNGKYQQIGILYKLSYENFLFRIFYKHKYYYISKRYDMEYFPFAKELNKQLYSYNNRIRITNVPGFTDDIFDKPNEKR